jgi:hypothetical protein
MSTSLPDFFFFCYSLISLEVLFVVSLIFKEYRAEGQGPSRSVASALPQCWTGFLWVFDNEFSHIIIEKI